MTSPKDTATKAPDDAPKKPKLRSPNHPLVDLAKAVELAEKIQTKYGAHDVPVNLVHKEWGYKEWATVPDQLVAALKSYGLIGVKGMGEKRVATLTDAGNRITRNAPDRATLLRIAAHAPTIHKKLFDHYKEKGLPSDDILRQYLVWGRPEGQRFNEDAVDGFIARFRKSLKFADAVPSDIMEEPGDEESGDSSIKIGDHIQWTCDGVDQYFRPMQISRIVDGFVFVEDNPTGIPMSQVAIVPPSAGAAEIQKTAFTRGFSPPTGQVTRELPITLPSLQVAILKVACPMSDEDYQALSSALTAFKNALTKKPETPPVSQPAQ